MEFWNDEATNESWRVLLGLAKKFKLVIIGGWACYLHTKAIKSRDVDIIVDFDVLDKIRRDSGLNKNEHLKKYETKIDGISIDIYVPYYSKLPLPIKEIQSNTMEIEQIAVPKPEVVLILKQAAELDRANSIKGQKDRVDILNLLLNTDINFKNYFKLVNTYNLQELPRRLKSIIITARKEFEYLGIINPREIKLKKQKILKKFQAA